MNNFPMLKKEHNKFLKELKSELEDTHNKAQKYRTETEMRYSVLNDGRFPTKASKYWQAVREQNVFYTNLRLEAYQYRKLLVEIKKLERSIAKETDELELELLQIELEEKMWDKEERERMGADRVREIEHWSRIKKELDDGTFDTQNVNTHQKESLKLQLQERAKNLTPGSSQGEMINVIGPLKTIDDADPSILSNITKVKMYKFITPTLNSALKYTISYNNAIYNPHSGHASTMGGVVSSSGFKINDDSSTNEHFLDDDGEGSVFVKFTGIVEDEEK